MIHPERDYIDSAPRNLLKDPQKGVYPSEKDIADIKRRGLKILRSKMVYQRKYENYTGRDGKFRERFLKWKTRLAVIETSEVSGVDTVWSTFSPTIGFEAIRLIISLMCDPARTPTISPSLQQQRPARSNMHERALPTCCICMPYLRRGSACRLISTTTD